MDKRRLPCISLHRERDQVRLALRAVGRQGQAGPWHGQGTAPRPGGGDAGEARHGTARRHAAPPPVAAAKRPISRHCIMNGGYVQTRLRAPPRQSDCTAPPQTLQQSMAGPRLGGQRRLGSGGSSSRRQQCPMNEAPPTDTGRHAQSGIMCCVYPSLNALNAPGLPGGPIVGCVKDTAWSHNGAISRVSARQCAVRLPRGERSSSSGRPRTAGAVQCLD